MNCMEACMPRQKLIKGYNIFNSVKERCLSLIVRTLVDRGRV